MNAEALVSQAAQLRDDVARHKAAIRRHRTQLGAAKARLDTIEAECRRLGIAVIRSQEHTHGAHSTDGPVDPA